MAREAITAGLGCLVLALASGCTQTLDFDAVSRGRTTTQAFSCEKQGVGATFCDDFEAAPPRERWSKLITEPAGAGTLDSDASDALSPSHSLLATYTGGPAGTGYTAVSALEQFATFENAAIHVVISFDMKVELQDPRLNARIAAFQFLFGSEKTYNQLVLNLESRETDVSSQFTENFADSIVVPPAFGTNQGGFQTVPDLHVWSKVTLELDVFEPAGTRNTAKMSIDSTKLFDGALDFKLYGGIPRMELGIPFVDVAAATSPWRIRFDNLLVQIERK